MPESSMKLSPPRICAGAFGYLLITFPLAYSWHLIAFKETYDSLGYISREEPIIAFGFLAILMQGLLLSTVYPIINQGRGYFKGVGRFLLLMGVYHWTAHVLAEAAKHDIEPLTLWFPLETAYLAIQFSLGGLMFGLVHRSPISETTPTTPLT